MIRQSDARLIIVGNGSLVEGIRVAANPSMIGKEPSVGVFTSFPGEAGAIGRAVWLVPEAQVPERVLAISSSLATELGLSGGAREIWELKLQGFEKGVVSDLKLELMVDKSLDEAVRELSESRTLDGRFIYVSDGQRAAGSLLEVDGTPYRIQQLSPESMAESVFVLSAKQTRVSIFAPGNRAGVDIVILADCSGSMKIDDLTEVSEAPPTRSLFGALFGSSSSAPRSIPRIRALQKALSDLLERRLHIVGTTSRIALVAFGHKSELRFPRPGTGSGMIEIDENTPSEIVRQFGDTIATLKAENWNTNIGQALQFAASHLANYGKPNNERLIVLISDGADWAAKGDDAVGELVENALDEPVSLMEHLHDTMSIHLHAIGISSPEVFDRYLRRPGIIASQYGVSHRPNHLLLERLVLVGGGDPARTGDADVLDEYLQGLGTGVTRSVHIAQNRLDAPLFSPAEKRQIDDAANEYGDRRAKSEDADLRVYRDKLRRLYQDCNQHCLGYCQQRLFNPSPEAYDTFFEESAVAPASSERDFRLFIVDLFKVFDEGLLEQVRRWKPGESLHDVLKRPAEILHGKDFRNISILRNKIGSHDWTKGNSFEPFFDVCELFIGQRVIARDDSVAWLKMQRVSLDRLVVVLNDVLGALVDESARFGKPDTQAASANPIIHW